MDNLLRENIHEQTLVFTESNATAYDIARRHLIPVLTHETKAAERKRMLEAFRRATTAPSSRRRCSTRAWMCRRPRSRLCLGGTASAREYIQRLGRVLRKTGNRQAVLYEVIARDTVDAGRAQRRRPKAGTL